MADALKDQGNKAFQAKDYDKAIELFTQTLAISPNHVLYSNRSAAKAGKGDYIGALEDAEQCVDLNGSWSKGYVRKGAALHGLKRYDEAIEVYQEGLKIENSPALVKGLKSVQDAKAAQGEGDPLSIGKMFGDPNMFGKLAANPKTVGFLSDPAFLQKLQSIQQNPKLAESLLQTDSRMITVLGVLMGINMEGFAREEGSDELPPGVEKTNIPSSSSPPPPPPRASSSGSSSTTPAPKPEQPSSSKVEDVEMEEEDDEDAKAKKEAEAEKKLGAEAYRKKDFENAATHFQKAWDLWPKDIAYLSNLGAVRFEQKNYDECINVCEKAVEEGRSIRADFKLIAKALGRIGNAYAKKGDLPEAIKYYNKSLTEHRTPDVLTKLRDAERAQADAARLAYLDPEKSHQAREEGNTLFKAGDFAGAVKAYTESIKRDPADPRGYNNRSNAYTKLAALPEALKDAEEAIKVDPKFVKAYIRKSHVLFVMKDYAKAIEAIDAASVVDEDKKHTREIQDQMSKCQQAMFSQRTDESEEETLERAMRDPEVANIMGDPVMQSILQQAQTNPAALQDHMKNPTVRQKIMKLVSAGIIKTR